MFLLFNLLSLFFCVFAPEIVRLLEFHNFTAAHMLTFRLKLVQFCGAATPGPDGYSNRRGGIRVYSSIRPHQSLLLVVAAICVLYIYRFLYRFSDGQSAQKYVFVKKKFFFNDPQ